jgi:hypothetical protein
MRNFSTPIIASALLVCCTLSLAQGGGQTKPLLSPRGQATFTFTDGKKILVDYGRPSVRGRKIMGGLVPYGQIWRTGANEATAFQTEADLIIDGTKVPAGKYTLYTLPSEGTWKLIISKKTGQWGIPYPEGEDLARIDMKKERLDKPVEQLTISFDKTSDTSALMKLDWENTRVLVELREAK